MAAPDEHGLLPALAAHAARALGLREILDDGPTLKIAAERLAVSAPMLERLLAVLALDDLVRPLPGPRFVPGGGKLPEEEVPPAARLIVEVLRRGRALADEELGPEARLLGLRPEDEVLVAKAEAAAALLAPRFAEPGAFLDLGCGVGAQSEALLARALLARATLVDAHRSVLELAARRLFRFGDRVELGVADVRQLDLGARRYRAVLLCDLLHLLSRDAGRTLLDEVATRLEPGGALLVGELAPGRRATIYALSASLLGVGAPYDPDELAGLLVAAGFAPPSRHAVPGAPTAALYVTTSGR